MPESSNHKEFLKSLAPGDKVRLLEKRDGPALCRLSLYAVLVAGLATPIAYKVPFWPLLLLPLGILLAFVFTLQHECTHKTPFKTPHLNEVLGIVTGFLIVQPFYWFRYFHLAHHRYTNDPDRDPELTGNPKPVTRLDYFLHVSTVFYWTSKFRLLYTNAIGSISESYIPQRALLQIRREAMGHILCYGLLLLFTVLVSPILLWIWLVPLTLGFPVLRLYLLAEHGRCPLVENMFDNTRTTYTNSLVRFLAWNMPYHTEHHILPSVPFHRLPEFHQQTQDYLLQTEQSYTAFTRDYVANLEQTEVKPWE